jgi:hypothetical protein
VIEGIRNIDLSGGGASGGGGWQGAGELQHGFGGDGTSLGEQTVQGALCCVVLRCLVQCFAICALPCKPGVTHPVIHPSITNRWWWGLGLTMYNRPVAVPMYVCHSLLTGLPDRVAGVLS